VNGTNAKLADGFMSVWRSHLFFLGFSFLYMINLYASTNRQGESEITPMKNQYVGDIGGLWKICVASGLDGQS